MSFLVHPNQFLLKCSWYFPLSEICTQKRAKSFHKFNYHQEDQNLASVTVGRKHNSKTPHRSFFWTWALSCDK